ncbi:TPA: hypothetical protein QFL62_001971, partial [Enterococcus faecium]
SYGSPLFCELVVVNFILQKGLPFLYGFFHLHKIFYTLRRKEVKNRKTSDSFGDIRKTYMYKKKKVASLCTYMVCFYGCRAFL